MRFENKTVVVTGGTSGLGEAVVKAFTAEGAHVFFCGLDAIGGERVENETLPLKGCAIFKRNDVRLADDMRSFIDHVVTKRSTIDIAVNSAGISHPAALFTDHAPEIIEDVWRTNVMGVWHAMQYELAPMINAKAGSIINIASILSKSGAPWMAPYGMSKHAVVGMSKSAALDYSDIGIRINCVSPGPMQTPMFERALADIDGDMSKFAGGLPHSGPADPADVAKTVLYLASDEAANVTGANFIVDGGVSTG
ncbi:SDR family NAD(P)-dependent oxidoreductase [Kordiimonas aquimaris]|uniref:SDR family NAD(P)-dependent oxidoreductase n=1 Tax=Kordiimonas aquimaris TaxID=707591 RepID=UPI0021CEB4D0|nr:SDR family oxidoreductase [Kordiimonas aquimaris]